MDIPLWKKWLSYITPVKLEETSSDHNPELTVMLDRGRVQLLSGDAIYSWDDLYHNFGKAFQEINPAQYEYQDVLLLGLGLGSIPYILEKTHGLRYHYTAVEWDEAIIDLADRYTFSRLDSSVEMVTADASVFVEVCEEEYDMVIIDLFEDSRMPAEFETTEFLEACITLLRTDGLLLINRLSRSYQDKIRSERYYETVFQKALHGAWQIDTDGNLILCWQKKG